MIHWRSRKMSVARRCRAPRAVRARRIAARRLEPDIAPDTVEGIELLTEDDHAATGVNLVVHNDIEVARRVPTGYGHASSIGHINEVLTCDFATAGPGSQGSALAEALANDTPTPLEPTVSADFGALRKGG